MLPFKILFLSFSIREKTDIVFFKYLYYSLTIIYKRREKEAIVYANGAFVDSR